MCGIVGNINFFQKTKKEKVELMLQSIKHRGPDNQIFYSSKFFSIGIARLKIIDLSDDANQPFFSKDKKVSLIYNGEIYNFKEIKKNYFSDIEFRSKGDGEVLLYLYLKFGIGFLEKVKGMFAICILDQRFNKAYLIRDRFGIKPLYYYFNEKTKDFFFSSEIQSFFAANVLQKNSNLREVYRFLKFSTIETTNETWFKHITKVPQSCYLEVTKSRINHVKYYKFEENVFEDLTISKNFFFNTVSEIKKKLLNSFLEHSYFDTKAGIHLSGGSDSAILALLSKKLGDKLKTFTFYFKDKKFSEIERAKKISKFNGLKNYGAILNEDKLKDYLIKTIQIEYEPFSSMRIISQHFLYENFQDKAKVIFDGTGGDEIGAGYNYYLIPWFMDMISERNKNIFARFKNIFNNLFSKSLNENNFILGSLANFITPGLTTVDGSSFGKENLINPDFLKQFDNLDTSVPRPFKSFLRNAQYADLFYYKIPRSLRSIDRSSMRRSIEARVPFLDHELVETRFSVPSAYKILNKQQRIILKYPFRKMLPKSLLFKNKQTIADPQTKWILNNLFNFFLEIFSSKKLISNEIINSKEVLKHIIYQKKSKNHINSFFLYQLLSLELWNKYVLKI